MEVFMSEDVSKILWKKLVVVIGDSIQRCVYKDLVCLLSPGSNTRYLTSKELKAKGEIEFLSDKLLQGGQLSDIKTGIHYREVRQYDNGTSVVKFYFVTRCYSEHLESVLNELKTMQPHAVIMNSCLWDLHRYGPRGPDSYHINMKKLMDGLKRVIPSDAVFIWNSTLPLDSKCKGGFLLPYFESIPAQEIIEANFVAADIVRSHGFIFLDLHSIFVHQLYHRAKDGIHWNHFAHRRITNLLLLNLCREWNLPVPKRMPLEIPKEPHLHPLTERPHNASFGSYTSHLHVDRYGFGPSGHARYIVQQSNSYKDRFRLMGSPITPSSTVVSKDNQMPSPIISGQNPVVTKASGPFSTPMFASSPVEPVSKTKSYLQQNESTSILGSPLDEAPCNQKLGLSQNLQQELEDSSLGQRDSSEKIPSCSIVNKISVPSFLNATGTQSNILTFTSSPSTASQTSSLVIQVLSSRAASRENNMTQKQPSTLTSTMNPTLSSISRNHASQFNLPAIQVTSAQVTKATPSQATKTTPCCNERSTFSAPLNRVDVPTNHASRVTVPVNQGMSSRVTKTTTSINQHISTCTSVCDHRPQLSTSVISSVTKTTQSTGKEKASCTTGNSIPSLAGGLPAKKQPVTTTVRTSQQRENIPVIGNQEKSSLNTQSQKELHAVRSSVDCVIQTKNKLCVDSSIAHLNKQSKIRVSESSQVIDKTQAITEASSTKRKTSVKDIRRKTSDDVRRKKQKFPERTCASSSGKSHSEAEKSSSERALSTKLPKVSSGGQKRQAEDDGDSRNTKQRKISETEETADDTRKPSSDLKRKAPTENTGNENVRQTHNNLQPPLAKRRKDERDNSNTTQQYPIRNALPLSGQASSTSYASIPVHARNRMESRSVSPRQQSVPSNNFIQGNCYWTGTQQSLQDIQQQQMWFNTLLSRGRAGPYVNNTLPSMFYNYYTRSWQIRQVYYHYHNYRY